MIVDPSHLLKNIKSFHVKDSLEVKKLIVWIAAQSCVPSVHTCSPESQTMLVTMPARVPHTVSLLSPVTQLN